MSVELLQMRGEHDDKLKWREEAVHEHHVLQRISIQMIAQHSKAQSPEKFSRECYLCSCCFRRVPPHEDLCVCQSISTDKFIDHQRAERLMVLNDTIVLSVEKYEQMH